MAAAYHHGADDELPNHREPRTERRRGTGMAKAYAHVGTFGALDTSPQRWVARHGLLCRDYLEEDGEDFKRLKLPLAHQAQLTRLGTCRFVAVLDFGRLRDGQEEYADKDVPQVEAELLLHVPHQV